MAAMILEQPSIASVLFVFQASSTMANSMHLVRDELRGE